MTRAVANNGEDHRRLRLFRLGYYQAHFLATVTVMHQMQMTRELVSVHP